MAVKNCAKCDKEFHCGNPGVCWCSEFPYIPFDSTEDCLCKECLTEIQKVKIESFIDSNPLQESIKLAADYYNPDNLIENIDYSVENGKWVFSRWFLLKRGFCCDSGCRNCPYNS